MRKKRIAITGIGPIASTGIGKDAFWEGVVNKNINIELVKAYAGDMLWEEFYVHKIKGFDINQFGLNPNDLEYIQDWKESPIDWDLQYLLASVKLALDDSGIDYKNGDNSMGLVLSNESPGMEDLFTNVLNETFQESGCSSASAKKFFDTISTKIMKSGYEAQTFMFLFHVARTFRVHQYSLFLNNACASGLYAIEAASDMIRLEKAPVVIVAASDHANIYKHLWFKSINMYASDGKIKPYAEGNNGLVMGEGATALILEDYDHAMKRGAHIYAEYLGGGFRLEGWKVTIPQLGGASYSDAIEDALTASGLDRDEIDLVCGHAPGTTASDNYEAQAIMNVFSGRDVPVTAFKPYVGHVLGASTLVETAILLLAMKNGFVPPVMNTARIDSRIKVNVIQEDRKENLTTTMKLCCAFAGYNAASVFRKIS